MERLLDPVYVVALPSAPTNFSVLAAECITRTPNKGHSLVHSSREATLEERGVRKSPRYPRPLKMGTLPGTDQWDLPLVGELLLDKPEDGHKTTFLQVRSPCHLLRPHHLNHFSKISFLRLTQIPLLDKAHLARTTHSIRFHQIPISSFLTAHSHLSNKILVNLYMLKISSMRRSKMPMELLPSGKEA